MQHAAPKVSTSTDISMEELQLAARNHSMPLEALRYDVTPVGLHYLLTHFDIPEVDPGAWRLDVGGSVRKRLAFRLDDLKAMPKVSAQVLLECAGNGRALHSPRPISQPWLYEAVGNAEWTGTPLRDFLKLIGADTRAKYCWFQCADKEGYNSPLDMATALHPQTQMTFKFGDEILPRAYGFPMKIRVPTKLGFKNPKYVISMEVTNEYKGGYWEDQGYNSFSGS